MSDTELDGALGGATSGGTPAGREQWSSGAGFVLAAIGSAVGLGNMWRFSYMAAEHGGAAFVLLYLLMTVIVGLPIMLAEFALGRASRRSPIAAMAHFGGKRWPLLGWLFTATGMLILAYYGVISGWTLRYALEGLTKGFAALTAAHFDRIATGGEALAWHIGFMALVVAIVARGVQRGIERLAMVLMPLLFVILLGLAVYAATLPGAVQGYARYLTPNFRALRDLSVWSDAAGQAFFSLSLGMGCMLTYASYLDRRQHLPRESLWVAGADFSVAFVSGLVVFPLIFALGLAGDVQQSTLGALFITLPKAFATMGGAGLFVGLLFFGALAVGALTSAMSLLEVVTAAAMDGLGWSRRRAAAVFGVTATALGGVAALDFRALAWMDRLAGTLFLGIGALVLAVFVGWFAPQVADEIERGAGDQPWKGVWLSLLRLPVPALLTAVVYFTLASW